MNKSDQVTFSFVLKKLILNIKFFFIILLSSIILAFILKYYIDNTSTKEFSSKLKIYPYTLKEVFLENYPDINIYINRFSLDYIYVLTQLNEDKNFTDQVFRKENINERFYHDHFRSETILFNQKYENHQIDIPDNISTKPSLEIIVIEPEKKSSLYSSSVELQFKSSSYENNTKLINLFIDKIIANTLYSILQEHIKILEMHYNKSTKMLTYYQFQKNINYNQIVKMINRNSEILNNYKNITKLDMNKSFFKYFSNYIVHEKEVPITTLSTFSYLLFSIIFSLVIYIFGNYFTYSVRNLLNNN